MCAGTEGFRIVLDDTKAAVAGKLDERRHVARMPIDVNRDDCSGSLRHRICDRSCIERPRRRVDVDEHGSRSRMEDRARRRCKGEVRDYHLIARPNANTQQRQMKRGRPVAHRHCERHVVEVRDRALEGAHKGSLRGDPTGAGTHSSRYSASFPSSSGSATGKRR